MVTTTYFVVISVTYRDNEVLFKKHDVTMLLSWSPTKITMYVAFSYMYNFI